MSVSARKQTNHIRVLVRVNKYMTCFVYMSVSARIQTNHIRVLVRVYKYVTCWDEGGGYEITSEAWRDVRVLCI